MKVDTEILPFFNALICVINNTVNLTIELWIFSQILTIPCFGNTFDGVSLRSQATHSGQVFTY